jgi:hypothetical protein
MAQTTLSIRVDSQLKKDFDYFCQDMGMNMTTALSVFMRQAVRENRIPFEIKGDIPNAETIKAIEETEKGTGLSKSYSSVDKMMVDLNA